jgi:hypothetical protein
MAETTSDRTTGAYAKEAKRGRNIDLELMGVF